MTTYKGIRGLTIRTVAGDPSPLAIGDIWYSSTTKKVRGAKNVGAWASGGNMNSNKEAGASSKNGTQTAYLAISGRTPPNSVNDFVESYDGSSWTEIADVNTARRTGNACGTSTVAWFAGGVDSGAHTRDMELWNGTSWTEVANKNNDLASGACFGNGSTTGIVCGATVNESWNGASWTETGGHLNQSRGFINCSGGTPTAGIAAGGQKPGSPNASSDAETYNGTSWTEVSDLNTARQGPGGIGNSQTAILCAGGNVEPYTFKDEVEEWDGTSWSETSDLTTAVEIGACAGSTTAGVIAGGTHENTPGSSMTNATEEWTFAASATSFTSS